MQSSPSKTDTFGPGTTSVHLIKSSDGSADLQIRGGSGHPDHKISGGSTAAESNKLRE